MKQEEIIQGIKYAVKEKLEMEVLEEDIVSILAFSYIKVHKKGEVIFGMKERITAIGVVLDGMLRSYYLDADGTEVTKGFVQKNELYLDGGLVGMEESICSYETIQNSIVLYIDCKKLKQFIREKEVLMELYIRCLEYGIRYKLKREKSFLTLSATERYLQFQREYPGLENVAKQAHIATYLGITPESLSRIRKALKSSEGEES